VFLNCGFYVIAVGYSALWTPRNDHHGNDKTDSKMVTLETINQTAQAYIQITCPVYQISPG